MTDAVEEQVTRLRNRVDALERARQILQVQQQILEMTARGSPQGETLTELCELIAALVPGALTSVMELSSDAEGPRLDMVATAGIPESVCARFAGLRPAPDAASCGTAAYTGKSAIVEDTAQDPRWRPFRALADELGIRACWSIPILLGGEVVATFAISHSEPRSPDEFQDEVLRTASHLAGLAIHRQRSEDDLVRAAGRVRQLEKFESLGIMAGGVAHDFNNLLTGVIGHAELAQRSLPRGSDALARIDAALQAAQGCSALCAQMLTFAGRPDLQTRTCDLVAVVRIALDMMRTVVQARATLRVELSDEALHVHADPDQVAQVVVNLLVNAMDAIEAERGEIVVRAGTREFDRAALERAHGDGLEAGIYACVEVADDGHGIDDAVRSRMFDPFFTTRSGGRGLGLASALGIVRAHGGAIDVHSGRGEGTTVLVLLPLRPAAPLVEKRPPAARVDPSATGVETVLVVDDEMLVRDLARAVLEDGGYRVREAASGTEALAELAGEPVDLVLLDVTMPDMSGLRVLEHVRATLGDLPTIVSTGHVHLDLESDLAGDAATSLLPKPYRPRDLLQAVRTAIDGRTTRNA